MMKPYLQIAAAATTLLLAVASSITICWMHNEITRLKNNQRALTRHKTVEDHTTSDGKHVAEVQALNLKVAELKDSNDSLLAITRSLEIKRRRLVSLTQATTTTGADITAAISDSVVVLPGRTDTLSCITFSDPWLTVDGCIRADTFAGRIECRDTLDFIVHRVPKRFLFFRFGCKAIHLDAVNHNPHSHITHVRYIRLEK